MSSFQERKSDLMKAFLCQDTISAEDIYTLAYGLYQQISDTLQRSIRIETARESIGTMRLAQTKLLGITPEYDRAMQQHIEDLEALSRGETPTRKSFSTKVRSYLIQKEFSHA